MDGSELSPNKSPSQQSHGEVRQALFCAPIGGLRVLNHRFIRTGRESEDAATPVSQSDIVCELRGVGDWEGQEAAKQLCQAE